MAAPRLRLRRGTANPQTLTDAGETFALNPALVGEPFFADTDGTVPTVAGTGTGDFYIADGGTAFVHIGGSSYTARTDEFLTAADTAAAGTGGQVTFTEGGPTVDAETVIIRAPDGGDMTGSYSMILPINKPAVAGDYLLEYDQATEQLSFVASGAGEQLLTQQAPADADATPDDYFLTFVANNNTAGTPQLETFYTEQQLVFYPDKDANVGGDAGISSLQITGEYVASTGYFSGTGSTDTASVTTNFATEPTASGNTKAVNVGTGSASGSTTNINIGSAVAGKTDFLGTDNNTLGTVASGAVQMDGGLGVALNATIGGDLSVVGGDIVADPNTLGAAASLYDTSTGTVNVAGVSGTLNLGNDTTGATTVNIATGATAAGTTKTVNIATNGAANSTTAVNIGSVTEPDQTTVTINGNLTVTGAQTVTNIQTTNTNITDALITLNDGADANPNNSNDIGLFLERGSSDENVFVGFDEDPGDSFVIAYTSSANTATGNIAFQAALVGSDVTTPTPLDFLPLQIGELRISDATSRRADGLITEGASVNEVVIGHLTASEANTEFSVSDATAGRHVYNVIIDGGSY